MRKLHPLFVMIPVMLLALACGSSKSTVSSTGTTVGVSGTLNFDSAANGLQKARFAASDTGTVTFTNIDTGATTSIPFNGESYGANIAPGNYSVSAVRQGDNAELRTYLPNLDGSSELETAIDLDTTVAALWIDNFDKNNYAAISSFASMARTADLVLGSTSSSNTQLDAAVMINFMKNSVHSQLKNGKSILSGFSLDTTKLATTPSANLFGHLSGNIHLSDGRIYTSGNANLAVVNPTSATNIVFNIQSSAEKMVIFSTDYTSSSISLIDVTSGNVNSDTSTYPISDINITSFGRHFYAIGRRNADFVEKRDIANPGINLYGIPYSTLDSSETSSLNPHSLIFSSRKSAVLTRYGSNLQWFVDPSAQQSSKFKTGSIDLGHYDSNDGIPEISAGYYLNGKTYLLAQRLNRNNGWAPGGNAYLIVLDTQGKEIDTGKAAAGSNLLGIELPVHNPLKMVYSANLGKLVVQGVGAYGSSFSGTSRQFFGGIVTVDPTTYEAMLLIDDDNGKNEVTDTLIGGGTYGGLISDVAIVSESTAYFITYSQWQVNSLHRFNPSTGAVGNVISGFAATPLADIEADRQGRLWILSGDTVHILDPATDTSIKTFSGFTLPPRNITPVRY
jgi:hypothetical protein